MVPSFDLLSSARYDPALKDIQWNTVASGGTPSPYMLLNLHVARLREAAAAHQWKAAQDLSAEKLARICDAAVRDAHPQNTADVPLKIRVLVHREDTLTASAAVAAPLSTPDPSMPSLFSVDIMAALSRMDNPPSPSMCGPVLTIYLDAESTCPTLFTCTKTTHRPMYTASRSRAGLPQLPSTLPADVLLYTTTGELMETSIRNVAFLRGSPTQWVTPRTETGCLPGVMRRWLLEQGRIVQGELRKQDVVEGEYVLTFNAVEGCRLGRVQMSTK